MHYLDVWRRTWQQLGVACPDTALLDELIGRYSEPHRKYHTMQHLDECFTSFATVRGEAVHPAEIGLALWFHDAIYDVKNHDNELKSADWARSELLRAGAAEGTANRVHALVMVTRHNALPSTIDEQILVDIDLSVLGAEPNRFDEYETQVRAEYAWVPEPVYRSRRSEILQAFLDRNSIYSTPCFQSRFETQARSNLMRSLAKLAAPGTSAAGT